MWTSLVTSLPLILVIMTAWVDGQQYWAVNYGPSYVCALKGTTVKLSCVLNYPHDHEITTVFWSKTAEGETPNLCLVPEYRGRVQCDSEYKDTYRITLTSVTEADKHMYYCRFTTNRGTWTGIPGAQLDVTDLQVETQPSVKERDSVTLTCKSSCSLPQQTFIWYRNTQIVTTGIRKVNNLQLWSVSRRRDSGNYQCAVSGYPRLISPPVYLKVQGVDDLQDWGVNYSPSYVCALKGSTVKLSCTLNYPHDHELKTVFWTKPAVTDGETPNLCLDSENRRRVQCDSEYKDTYNLTLTNITEADKHMYYCRFTTNRENGKWTGIPGAQLDVTDLQVETQQSVKEGGKVILRCKSSCSLPQQTFIWYRNRERFTELTVNHLQLPSVSRRDSGNYQCAVSEYPHLISPPVYLKVGWVDGLLDWGVNYSPSYVCALKGSTVKMSCTSTFTGYHELTTAFWTKTAVTDGEPLNLCLDPEYRERVQCVSEYKDTYRITLTSVTEDDKHMYYCRFRDTQNKIWTVIPGARLDVTDLQVETQPSVKERDSVTLTCKSSCSLPQQTTFIWYRNRERFTEQTVNHLQLPSVSRRDSGNYRCAVSGYLHLISPPVYLKVGYPPKSVSVSISASGEIVEGDSVTLNCSSDSNPPALNFSWFKEGKSVGSGRIYNISKISSDHSGEYKCRSRNKHGEKDSDAVKLNVMYPPKSVSVSISASGEIVEGDSVTLNCSSDSNPPALNFSWFKENQSSAVGSGQSFIISSFNSRHSGRYYCAAQNQYGSQRSASVSVSVKGIQRAALHTLTGIVTGCGALIFIIIIIVFIKKKRRDGGAEVVRQNQDDRVGRSAETSPTNDVPVYSLVSANHRDDLYANIKVKKAKCSGREQTEKDSGDAEEIQYASVHLFKNKDMNTTEETIEMQHPSDANRSEDVIYSSVK